VARQPAGKVSEVLTNGAELQGAYDFLESPHVQPQAVIDAITEASFVLAKRCPFVFAAVDGSSLKLTDAAGLKDFGSVGAADRGARGLKVLDSLLVSPQGEPLGLASLQWWCRIVRKRVSASQRRNLRVKLPVSEKETQHWLAALDATKRQADNHNVHVWFQLDREADNQDLLWHLAHSEHLFTVRSSWDRVVVGSKQQRCYLRSELNRHAPLGSYQLRVAAGPQRSARQATMRVRVAQVSVVLKDKADGSKRFLDLTAVLARESSPVPAGEKPLDWLLLTNKRVSSLADAQQVIYGYTQRWRVEEFHKTWKSGACNVEQTQLRSAQAVKTWASILASVANRIERLKHLSRNEPELPASSELTTYEIRALLHLRREIQCRAEIALDAIPTIAQATLWIAELGGYTGKSSGGPPGSITIRRGLERLEPAALLLKALDADPT
jgi:hypothetical protein